ncbi:potassium-transporting ATPase subunit C [Prauserella endophytica]|uniref:Potassium-transporting ATPase KdpC subunit n=1 Tax=Prauserella endophytica TaxID=1592324 RepID=A0ABY2S5Y8_9PSEU|nr:potassium-transporting ATPase subunit C [Prauserella endophytica]PXY26104.1 K+-transporting ATPase subunit C [Prauserella coralliicola]TKG71323.1 potassium-transporting ATPase subunit C [Prauserella endophytica]
MLKSLFSQCRAALRVLLVFTLLLGVVYPLGVWAVSRLPGLEHRAEGSLIERNGTVVGSSLIGIDPVFDGPPTRDPWFHTRPSASAEGPLGPGDPSASGGSNKSAFDPGQVELVRQRRQLVAERENVPPSAVPADAVTASASGVDPDISEAYADLQTARVARNTGLSEARVRDLVAEHTSTHGIGVRSVNVLELNLAVRDARSTLVP